MKIILHPFFQILTFGLFFFFLIPTSPIQCESSNTKILNNVADGNVTSNSIWTNSTLKWSLLFQKLNQENLTQKNVKTVYINQPHLKGTFLIRKKRAHGKGWMRPTKSGGHSTRQTNSGRKPFSTTNKTKRKASIQPLRNQPLPKAYPQRKASVGYQLKQAKSGTSKLKSIPKLKLAPKISSSLDQHKSHAPPASTPLRKASIGFKLAQSRESKKQATGTLSSDNEKKDATTSKPKIQRKAFVGHKLAQTKKDQTQKESTKSKSESSSSSDSKDGHKGKPGEAKTLQKSSDGSKQETSKSESSNADQPDSSSTLSTEEAKRRKTADRSSQQSNAPDTPESLSEHSETGEKAKKQQPSGDQKQETQKSTASASGNPDEPNNGPTGTSTHTDTSDDSSSSEKTEESSDRSPGRVKTQRKASVGNKLEEQRKAEAAAAAAAAAARAAAPGESASTKAPPARPDRHYISEDRGPRDKPPKGTKFNPEEISTQASLTTETKNADSDRFPTQQVQTDPEAGNRVVYQSSVIGRENLDKGTDVNNSARKKVQEPKKDGEAQQGGEEGQEEGKKDQAGHMLAKRLGGQGTLDNVIPQNAKINQGNGKEMEAVIAQDVKDYGQVRYTQLNIYDDQPDMPKATRPSETRFKVETLGGDLIRYGIVDNPPNKPENMNPLPRPADGA